MKDKNVAGILALIFGVFGVHRFYLGQTGLGILYVLLFIFTLGTVPALLGLLDAVLFFVMDKDSFDDKYNRQKRGRRQRGRFADEGRENNRRRREFEERRRRREYEKDKDWDKERRRDSRREPRYHKRPDRKKVPTYKGKNKQVSKINPYKAKGIAKFKDYNFEASIEDFKKALNVDPKDIALHWNIACAYSMEEQVVESLFHLSKAVELGFVDFNRIKTHDALAYVRSTDDFDTFVKNGYKITKEIKEIKEEPKEEQAVVEVKQLDIPKENILDELPPIPEEKEEEVPEDLLEQIQKLSELRDKGYLSAEEFAMQKKKILG